MTKAIILAAGQGSRLRPLTEERPKCMVEFEGKPLLERQISILKKAGIEDITVIAGYRNDVIKEAIKDEKVTIRVNPKYDCTNMVATLFSAADMLNNGNDYLICYGDLVFEQKVLEKILKCQSPIGVSVDTGWKEYWQTRMENPLEDAETLKIDERHDLTEIGKKPKSYDEIQGQYMGLIRIRADVVESFKMTYESMDKEATYDGKDYDNMYMTSFLQHLIDLGWPVKAVFVEHGWLEFDTVEDIELYKKMLKENTLDKFFKIY